VDSACDKFLNTHGASVSCKALVDGQEKQVDGGPIVEPCKKVKDLIKHPF
jgi:hypothetical protein